MALADYKLCDVCGEKAFYDANLNYDSDDVDNPVRESGEKLSYYQKYSLDYLGDWAVICNGCSGKYKTQIVPIVEEHSTEDDK